MKRLGYLKLEPEFPTLNRYWTDPDYRRRIEAETKHNRDIANAAIDAGLAKHRGDHARAIKEQSS
jgi:hypothetical protein